MELQERLEAYERLRLKERLELFGGMIHCNYPLYMWEYDGDWAVANSNCPDEHLLDILFTKSDYMPRVRENDWEEHKALLVGGVAGIMWGAIRDDNGHFHVLGPVLSSESSAKDLSELTAMVIRTTARVENSPGMRELQKRVVTCLQALPTIPVAEFCKQIAMLYYCVQLRPIRYSDVTYQITQEKTRRGEPKRKDRYGTWIAEQALLGMVRNGDLDYHAALSQAASVSRGVPLQNSDHLRQAKLSSQVFSSLCTRAAIEGGLSPEQAYTVGDSYIQQIEECKTVSEILGIANTMYDDFINRVHRQMMDPALPRQIRACMDYIANHLGDKLTNADLAAQVGYSESALCHRFREATGVTIGDYIRMARVERAKLELTTTRDSLQAIAERLGFCGRSHFTTTFQRVVGMSPDAYRKQHGQ